MSETTYLLEIEIGNRDYGQALTLYHIPFATKADADEQLALLEPKIGERLANDPDKRRHRIVSPAGDVVIQPDQVRVARILDFAAFARLTAYWMNKNKDGVRFNAEVMAQALVTAGAIAQTLPAPKAD